MQIGVIIAILAILVPLWVLLRKDFVRGLAFAIFFWVSMTTLLRIQLPGSFPALTIHRLMLIVVTIAWFSRNRLAGLRSIPMRGAFAFWFAACLISLLGTQITFMTSLKSFLDFVLEVFIFYIIMATSVQDSDDALRVLRAAWLGLLAVAFCAAIERHTGFNPVERFIPGVEHEAGGQRVITSTYPHRILLGTAMAMGVPLTFMLLAAHEGLGKRFRFFWAGVGLLGAASYYGMSRGPWIGLALACAIMFVLGSMKVRKKLILIGSIGMIALLARPGVIGTLTHFAQDTVDKDSFKGGTAQYRMELWKVAFHEISKSPWTFLFGYGPSAGTELQFEWRLSYSGKLYLIDSWDNHFAYSLFQSGFIGLVATLILYLSGGMAFYKEWRRSAQPRRDVMSALIAAAAVLIWMMTNVLIFAKQIDYLFWTIIAAGLVIVRSSNAFEPNTDEEEEIAESVSEPTAAEQAC